MSLNESIALVNEVDCHICVVCDRSYSGLKGYLNHKKSFCTANTKLVAQELNEVLHLQYNVSFVEVSSEVTATRTLMSYENPTTLPSSGHSMLDNDLRQIPNDGTPTCTCTCVNALTVTSNIDEQLTPLRDDDNDVSNTQDTKGLLIDLEIEQKCNKRQQKTKMAVVGANSVNKGKPRKSVKHTVWNNMKKSELQKICVPCGRTFHSYSAIKYHETSKAHQLCQKRLENKTAGSDGTGNDLIQWVSCDQCSRLFYDSAALGAHRIMHKVTQAKKDLLETYRNTKLAKYEDFMEYFKNHKRSDYHCPECDIVHTRGYIITHLCSHVGLKILSCSDCDFEGSDVAVLLRHYKARHGGEKINHKMPCHVCGKIYTRTHLREHEYNEHGFKRQSDRVHMCAECGRTFLSTFVLKAHMAKLHERSLSCTHPNCKYKAGYVGDMKSHMMVHTEERPFHCDRKGCSFAAKSIKRLKMHKSWRHDSSLQVYPCNECNYKAKTKFHLFRHASIHTGLKPFHCPHCEYCCNVKSNLRIHIRRCHKELKVFNCKLCNFATNIFPEYRFHVGDRHNESLPLNFQFEDAGIKVPSQDASNDRH